MIQRQTPMTRESKAIDAEARCARWLADSNEARERGDVQKADWCYAKAQYWKDRYNKLTDRS